MILAQDATLESPARALRIPAHRAFTRVLTHAHSFDPDNPVEAARLSRDYLDLVTRVPVVEFTYRPDFSQFDEVLSRALRSTPLGETFDERESPVPSTRTP